MIDRVVATTPRRMLAPLLVFFWAIAAGEVAARGAVGLAYVLPAWIASALFVLVALRRPSRGRRVIVDEGEIRAGEAGIGDADIAGEVASVALDGVRALRIVHGSHPTRLEITASATVVLAEGELQSLQWVATRLLEHAGSKNGPLAFAREAARCCSCREPMVVLAGHRAGWRCTACGKTCVSEHRALAEAA